MINRTYFYLECFDMIHSFTILVFVFQPDCLTQDGNPCSLFDQCKLGSCLQVKQPRVLSLDSRQSWKSFFKARETNETYNYDELPIQIYQTWIFPVAFLVDEQNGSQITILGPVRNISFCQAKKNVKMNKSSYCGSAINTTKIRSGQSETQENVLCPLHKLIHSQNKLSNDQNLHMNFSRYETVRTEMAFT